jgi:two-component system, NarL family, nitrate/nitrite response regulator NarL
MIKILIADDHQMFIDGLKSILKSDKGMSIVGEAHNGLQVIELLQKTEVDLILMDVNMPEMDGINSTKQLLHQYPHIKVLMLTMHNSRDYIEKVMRAGAHGYILKNTGKEELSEAIHSVMQGNSYYSKEVTEKIMEGLQRKKVVETNVLLVQEYTSHEIADKLFISFHTVETHRKNLISKLQVKNIAGLVKYAIQQGIVE